MRSKRAVNVQSTYSQRTVNVQSTHSQRFVFFIAFSFVFVYPAQRKGLQSGANHLIQEIDFNAAPCAWNIQKQMKKQEKGKNVDCALTER